MQCGLLGRKLGHSYSPQIHQRLGDYPYTLYEREPEELEEFLLHGPFNGINVTIPYKKAVIPYCDALTPIAQRMGAVNTIVRRADGSLIGHNSDYFGFSSMVKKSGLALKGKKVLVLGSGGACATVTAVLNDLGAEAVVISRSGENHYGNLQLHEDAAAIVNTTPVGMYPNTGESPLDITRFPKLEGILDLIYNPARTQLLLQAETIGIAAMNGLWMLVAQAKESAEWFTGEKITDSVISQIHQQLCGQMENIILVGMPGCGKSTVGKLLADRLQKSFLDADAEIEAAAGMPIPEMFKTQGEEGFRKIETAVLSELGKRSAHVIATGGGCVTRQENYPLLHQNGKIIWLQRDISCLPTDGRPLSQAGKLMDMYHTRAPMYQSFADIIAHNDSTPEAAVDSIIQILSEEI